MKKLIISLSLSVLALTPVGAQNSINDILSQIESNNSTLKALRDARDAQMMSNNTGIFLDNPEVEFAYLWGNPSDVPGRHDVSVTQKFDMATLLGKRKKVAQSQDVLAELQYRQQRIDLLLEAKKLVINIIYSNALLRQTDVRLQLATSLADAYDKKMQSGDANLLEVNKIKLNLTSIKSEQRRLKVEHEALMRNLQSLNGGISIACNDTAYLSSMPADDFASWYSVAETKNPMLAYVQGEIAADKEQVKLNKTFSLPSLSLGYKSEIVKGQSYRGAAIGIDIPLWSNKNRVKQAEAELKATESRMSDAKQQFYSQLSIQFLRTKGLYDNVIELRQSLDALNNGSLLRKALDAGQISLLDFLIETSLYYDSLEQLLTAEKEYQLVLADLQMVEL